MLTILAPSHHSEAKHLFAGLDEHLVLASIFAGTTPAPVYVDDPSEPRAGFTLFKHRALLGGAPEAGFVADLGAALNEQIIPACLSGGIEAFVVSFDHPAWQGALPQLLPGRTPIQAKRQYYRYEVGDPARAVDTPGIPAGINALAVDAALLGSEMQHVEALREETCSERVSVEDFIEHSFGMCLAQGGELAAWCLSEYNCDGRCEVGVATHEKFQRRGLGTLVTRLFLEQARARGMRQVGWHCWSRNLPSGALARRSGFDLIKEFDAYIYRL